MFDVATRPQPGTVRGASALRVPFDWRLTVPAAVADYPWTDFGSPTGVPQRAVEPLATYAIEMEDTLQTAIILSLFSDRRAGPDDQLPLNETDRRGWVGDEFMEDGLSGRPDEWGTLLWLYYTGKVTQDIPALAAFTCKEALAWMVRDGVASRVDVAALWVGEDGDRLAVRPQIYQPGRSTPVYDVLWDTSIRRFAP